jgi:hypothetical protein
LSVFGKLRHPWNPAENIKMTGKSASLFTPAEMQTLLRPLVQQLALAGVPRDRIAEVCTLVIDTAMRRAGEGPASTFAADSDDKVAFTAADAPNYSRWFGADDNGLFPGGLHRFFGLDVRAFAVATGLQRAHRDGRWYWRARASG